MEFDLHTISFKLLNAKSTKIISIIEDRSEIA